MRKCTLTWITWMLSLRRFTYVMVQILKAKEVPRVGAAAVAPTAGHTRTFGEWCTRRTTDDRGSAPRAMDQMVSILHGVSSSSHLLFVRSSAKDPRGEANYLRKSLTDVIRYDVGYPTQSENGLRRMCVRCFYYEYQRLMSSANCYRSPGIIVLRLHLFSLSL